jgi:hypothetical protein
VHIIASFRTVFGATFGVTGGYLKFGTSFLKRVTWKVFKIIDFKEANMNFIYFSPQKGIFRTLQKIFIS